MRWINTWLDPNSGRIVLLQAKILPLLDMYRQLDMKSVEAGGILLGYRRGAHLEVIRISEPCCNDIRKRMFFDRRDPCHQQQAIAAWRESGQFIDYVGEWHTHPEKSPTPSGLDLRQWHVLRKRTEDDPMLELIIGTEEMWAGLIVKGNIRTLIPTS
jgi:integrative and conjugative element protein (TIGR02256 family)